jgi:hypothetical protein
MLSNRDIELNELYQGKTVQFPQAYTLFVIFVREGIVYGQLQEPLTRICHLMEYDVEVFLQLVSYNNYPVYE